MLAHEAVHLGGERREGVTECLALQEAVPLAVRLGLTEDRARALVRSAYERRLAERNAIRAAYALPTRVPRRRRARPHVRATRRSRSGAGVRRQVGHASGEIRLEPCRTSVALEPPSCSPSTAEPRAFASTTIRSRSCSSVPRATKSAERAWLPHSSSAVEAAAGLAGRAPATRVEAADLAPRASTPRLRAHRPRPSRPARSSAVLETASATRRRRASASASVSRAVDELASRRARPRRSVAAARPRAPPDAPRLRSRAPPSRPRAPRRRARAGGELLTFGRAATRAPHAGSPPGRERVRPGGRARRTTSSSAPTTASRRSSSRACERTPMSASGATARIVAVAGRRTRDQSAPRS